MEMGQILPNTANLDALWAASFDAETHYYECVCDYSTITMPATRAVMTDEQIEAIRADCEASADVESATVAGKVLTVKSVRPIYNLGRGSTVTKKERNPA
jgi:hypothetical protein